VISILSIPVFVQDLLLLCVSSDFAYYNFCRIHKTIRCDPAMEAGLTKTIWELKDLLKINGEK